MIFPVALALWLVLPGSHWEAHGQEPTRAEPAAGQGEVLPDFGTPQGPDSQAENARVGDLEELGDPEEGEGSADIEEPLSLLEDDADLLSSADFAQLHKLLKAVRRNGRLEVYVQTVESSRAEARGREILRHLKSSLATREAIVVMFTEDPDQIFGGQSIPAQLRYGQPILAMAQEMALRESRKTREDGDRIWAYVLTMVQALAPEALPRDLRITANPHEGSPEDAAEEEGDGHMFGAFLEQLHGLREEPEAPGDFANAEHSPPPANTMTGQVVERVPPYLYAILGALTALVLVEFLVILRLRPRNAWAHPPGLGGPLGEEPAGAEEGAGYRQLPVVPKQKGRMRPRDLETADLPGNPDDASASPARAVGDQSDDDDSVWIAGVRVSRKSVEEKPVRRRKPMPIDPTPRDMGEHEATY